MKRVILLTTISLFANGTIAAPDAAAFFIGSKSGQATRTATTSAAVGLRADQLKVGTKQWFEQMQREGRFGASR